jgi:hypothetical protein
MLAQGWAGSKPAFDRQRREVVVAPVQWILDLETRNGYEALLLQTGSLAVAAYHLARATCQVRPVPTNVPTRIELGAAAARIAERAGIRVSVPSASTLALDCEAVGLPVL